MSGTLTPYGREWLLRASFAQQTNVVTELHCALCLTVPDQNVGINGLSEPAAAVNYAREPVSLGASWVLNAQGELVYNPTLQWGPPFGDWGLLQGWALVTSTRVVAVGAMNLPRRIGVGTLARIPGGTLRIGLFG